MDDFKGTDIYLIDQILKGRYSREHKILDAGCGSGRNMRWFGMNGYSVFGCDLDAHAIKLAIKNTGLPAEKFKVCPVESLLYTDESFDHIICNAVLHFANSEEHFLAMIAELYRVLKSDGTLFIRMTSSFGLPHNYESIGDGRFLLADGTVRFLLNQKLLAAIKEIGFEQIEPIKSVLVEELRSMTTLVFRKPN